MRAKRSTTKGGTAPPSCTSSKKSFLRSMCASLRLDCPLGHDERVARVRHDLVVPGEGNVVVLDGASELADLPVLHPHGGLGPPLADGGPVDLPDHNPISCATISRFQVASPKVTSELFARLK